MCAGKRVRVSQVYAHTCTRMKKREGTCRLGGGRGERVVCVCAGEDEADKELCGQIGADPGPLTGASGLEEARGALSGTTRRQSREGFGGLAGSLCQGVLERG